jgi:hypothetical protein
LAETSALAGLVFHQRTPAQTTTAETATRLTCKGQPARRFGVLDSFGMIAFGIGLRLLDTVDRHEVRQALL